MLVLLPIQIFFCPFIIINGGNLKDTQPSSYIGVLDERTQQNIFLAQLIYLVMYNL